VAEALKLVTHQYSSIVLAPTISTTYEARQRKSGSAGRLGDTENLWMLVTNHARRLLTHLFDRILVSRRNRHICSSSSTLTSAPCSSSNATVSGSRVRLRERWSTKKGIRSCDKRDRTNQEAISPRSSKRSMATIVARNNKHPCFSPAT
jgi:hypothetical protein